MFSSYSKQWLWLILPFYKSVFYIFGPEIPIPVNFIPQKKDLTPKKERCLQN